MSDTITQMRLSMRLDSYLREYTGKHSANSPFFTREWDDVWRVADSARTQNTLTPELVDNVRVVLHKL